jgi:hypothetical protein
MTGRSARMASLVRSNGRAGRYRRRIVDTPQLVFTPLRGRAQPRKVSTDAQDCLSRGDLRRLHYSRHCVSWAGVSLQRNPYRPRDHDGRRRLRLGLPSWPLRGMPPQFRTWPRAICRPRICRPRSVWRPRRPSLRRSPRRSHHLSSRVSFGAGDARLLAELSRRGLQGLAAASTKRHPDCENVRREARPFRDGKNSGKFGSYCNGGVKRRPG